VQIGPVTIPGVAGLVAVDLKFFSNKHVVTVGGRPLARVGRATYELPTSNGRIAVAKLRTNALDPYPVIEIDGVKHRTGPAVPIALRVLALLPALLLVGGALGGAFAAAGVIGNMAIARTMRPAAIKAALMVAVLVAAAVAWLVLATALNVAIGS
jgi:hypothetical protein